MKIFKCRSCADERKTCFRRCVFMLFYATFTKSWRMLGIHHRRQRHFYRIINLYKGHTIDYTVLFIQLAFFTPPVGRPYGCCKKNSFPLLQKGSFNVDDCVAAPPTSIMAFFCRCSVDSSLGLCWSLLAWPKDRILRVYFCQPHQSHVLGG